MRQRPNAASLRKCATHYEKWWASVEAGLKDFCPVSIGAKQQNPVYLTSADWEEIYADNPGHVSNAVGGPRGGPWNVFVESDGNYEIMLTRWPPHLKLAFDAGRAPQKTDRRLASGRQGDACGRREADHCRSGARREDASPGRRRRHSTFASRAGSRQSFTAGLRMPTAEIFAARSTPRCARFNRPEICCYSGLILVQKSVNSIVSKNAITSTIFPSRIRMYQV